VQRVFGEVPAKADFGKVGAAGQCDGGEDEEIAHVLTKPPDGAVVKGSPKLQPALFKYRKKMLSCFLVGGVLLRREFFVFEFGAKPVAHVVHCGLPFAAVNGALKFFLLFGQVKG
jgi:hypothetical protein